MAARRPKHPGLSSRDVLDALEQFHGLDSIGHMQWAFAEEVPIETGGARRRIDALAINCWRSNQYAVRAYEVKVSRGDFLKELKAPWKSDAARALSNEFAFAAPRRMISPGELPAGVGLVEVDALGRIRTTVVPERTDRGEWSATFIASLIRSAQRTKCKDQAALDVRARQRALVEILDHHQRLPDAPAHDADFSEWREWALSVTGAGARDVWPALDRLRGRIHAL